MLNITRYVMLFEGGQAGHMAHPFDYTDFTCNDIVDLIDKLFSGKVEHMKEKLDGMNIFATMNDEGEVVFIRNNSNLNSEKGGMSINDMVEKWAEKEHQKRVFTQTGRIITEIFEKLGKEYFNPDRDHRKVINCECIVVGKTNIMPYASDRVAFHGYNIYEKRDGKWVLAEDHEGGVDDIYKAAEGIDAAKPRPDLVIKSAEEGIKAGERFKKQVIEMFSKEGLKGTDTIEHWKMKRYIDLKPEYIHDEVSATRIFNRWFNGDKSYKAVDMKKDYPDHYNELKDDKYAKKYVSAVMEPMDNLFLSIGNELIDLLDGFTNSGAHDKVVSSLRDDIATTIEIVKEKGSVDAQEKLQKSMERLKALGDKYNSAEGIVFMYKGRRMKLTGSFAPINQILGTRFTIEQ